MVSPHPSHPGFEIAYWQLVNRLVVDRSFTPSSIKAHPAESALTNSRRIQESSASPLSNPKLPRRKTARIAVITAVFSQARGELHHLGIKQRRCLPHGSMFASGRANHSISHIIHRATSESDSTGVHVVGTKKGHYVQVEFWILMKFADCPLLRSIYPSISLG